jgi:hypothetical protein
MVKNCEIYIYIHYKYILIYGYFMVKMAITIVIYMCVCGYCMVKNGEHISYNYGENICHNWYHQFSLDEKIW